MKFLFLVDFLYKKILKKQIIYYLILNVKKKII